MPGSYSSYPPPVEVPRVLLVDDDRSFLVTIEAILSSSFEVSTCSNGTAGLNSDLERFHVVCADYGMPDMDGLTFLTRVARRCPSVCCLLITGADDFYESVKHAARRPPVLFKPVDPERLTHTITHLASIASMKRAAA